MFGTFPSLSFCTPLKRKTVEELPQVIPPVQPKAFTTSCIQEKKEQRLVRQRLLWFEQCHSFTWGNFAFPPNITRAFDQFSFKEKNKTKQ